MKVYLASRYSRRKELLGYARELFEEGLLVTSSWLTTNWNDDGSSSSAAPEEQCAKWAQVDFGDVAACEVFVQFSNEGRSRGGNHVELGMALAWYKKVIVVGPKEHIFHRLPQLTHFGTWEQAKEYLKTLSRG